MALAAVAPPEGPKTPLGPSFKETTRFSSSSNRGPFEAPGAHADLAMDLDVVAASGIDRTGTETVAKTITNNDNIGIVGVGED